MSRATDPLLLHPFAALAILLSAAPAAAAQDSSVVAAGDPLRITAPALGLRASPAVLVGLRHDSLVLRSAARDSVPSVIALAAITRLEVNHGNRPPQRQTMLGAAVGGLVGLTVGAIASTQCSGYYAVGGSCRFDAGVAIASAGAGTLLGAGIGSLVKITRFKTVTLAPDLSASLAFSRRSAGLRILLRL